MKNIRHLRTARKEYSCEGCLKTIDIGTRYFRLFGSSDDYWHDPKPFEIILCEKCGKDASGLKDVQ